MSRTQGRFIVFEGIDGCGKSTQAALLARYLEHAGTPIVNTREPGGTDTGNAIRSVLLSSNAQQREPLTDILLMSAARYEHVTHVIRPAREAGKTVICDRFADSTYAYQVAGQHAPADIEGDIRAWICGDCVPDDIIIIDIAPELAARRLRLAVSDTDETYYERFGHAFYDRVRHGFLACADKEGSPGYGSRYHVLDGTLPEDELAMIIRRCLNIA